MRDLDFTPLYRSAIGFDRMANLLNSISRSEQAQPGYPPYNIELTGDDQYRISMAVAGFDQSDLDIQVHENTLTVTGKKAAETEQKKYLHQGIAARNFERHFQLAEYVEVRAASIDNGLLHIDLVREVPEAAKPKTIAINSDKPAERAQLTQANAA